MSEKVDLWFQFRLSVRSHLSLAYHLSQLAYYSSVLHYLGSLKVFEINAELIATKYRRSGCLVAAVFIILVLLEEFGI
jgi:hypothetical protein